jgi:hypothetical protein
VTAETGSHEPQSFRTFRLRDAAAVAKILV